MFAQKLKKGDEVRIVALARSMMIPSVKDEVRNLAVENLHNLGLNVGFGKHAYEIDEFNSSSIESRIQDFHEAIVDEHVNCILAVTGGFNSNQLLKYIDYDLIKRNPKIICGFSDITAISNAIYAKTGLVTYSGPDFFTFGDRLCLDYSLEYFRRCLFSEEQFEIKPSLNWGDEEKFNVPNPMLIKNEGFLVVNEGEMEGTLIGGNQSTVNLLQGTEFMPDIAGSILFLEDDSEAHPTTFDRDLQSIIHLPNFDKVKGLIIGRFQKATKMTNDLLIKIIKSKKELEKLPVIANFDFGHTCPMLTLPIGGRVRIVSSYLGSIIEIINH